ncbi:MAG TPA: co-chaperone DjlA [Steroidobacteraceae bacterium]|nr:co-chaperone DjlA [Steroidobacteraceae bacterium]
MRLVLYVDMAAGMKWFGKLTGGLIGLAFGPIGLAVGVLLGHQFDQAQEDDGEAGGAPADVAQISERFFRATFHVMGYLAKADGRVSEQEIAAARAVMTDLRLDAAQVRHAIALFTAGKHSDFDLDAELAALRSACRGRPDILRIFLEIQVRAALAGNNLEGPVRPLMQRIAAAIRVSGLELAQIEAVLRIQRRGFGGERPGQGGAAAAGAASIEAAYRVLEIETGASDAEVVKAYRRQLSRHHPDKLKANGLPESMVGHAKQRTQQIIEAYELIRVRRGMS